MGEEEIEHSILVFVEVTIAVMNTMTGKQKMEERAHFTDTSISQFTKEGSQGRKSNSRN